jgi:hypothetical protein
VHIDTHVCQRYSVERRAEQCLADTRGSSTGLASEHVTEKLHVDLSGAPQTMLATFYA